MPPLKEAPTVLSAVIVSVQVSVGAASVHPPVQPTKRWFLPGMAVKVTRVADE